MSYTDGKHSPSPTKSEKAFASLTDVEREAMSKLWLETIMGRRWVSEIYPPLHEEPKP